MEAPLIYLPALLQGGAMVVDEGVFHRRRGLGRWERLGHPIDTLSVAAVYAWLLAVPVGAPAAIPGFLAIAIGSCLLVTKDEPVHARVCGAGEQWLHAVLFLLHPIAFGAAFFVARGAGSRWFLVGTLAATVAFGAWQLLYWTVFERRSSWLRTSER